MYVCCHLSIWIQLRTDHFASIGTVPSLDFAFVLLPFVQLKLHHRGSQCAHRVIYLRYLRLVVPITGRVFLVFVGSFPRARSFDASRTTYEKRKPTGRKFITREQRVITLKADFSEQLRSRKRMHGTALWFSR